MADPYDSAKAGRLTFKGGSVAKSIDKKKKKKKNIKLAKQEEEEEEECPLAAAAQEKEVENIYTIDAAKKMNYKDLFPVEAKKFGYVVPNHNNNNYTQSKESMSKPISTVEAALDDRVKKKADRYCK